MNQGAATRFIEHERVEEKYEHGGVYYRAGDFYVWCGACKLLCFPSDTAHESDAAFERTHALTCVSPRVARSTTQAFWLERLFAGGWIRVPSRHEPRAILGSGRETRAGFHAFRRRLEARGFSLRIAKERFGPVFVYNASMASFPKGAPKR